MARAKRTDRTDARRRYRAEQAALTVEPDAERRPTAPAARSRPDARRPPRRRPPPPRAEHHGRLPGRVPPGRPAGRPARAAEDPDPLGLPRRRSPPPSRRPRCSSCRPTSSPSSLDLTLSDPTAGKPIGTISNISYIAVSLFVAPPPAAGAFLVGFTAPRASWLGGLIYGIVAAACYTRDPAQPAGRLFIGANSPAAVHRERLDRRPDRRGAVRLGVGLVQAVPEPRQPEPGPASPSKPAAQGPRQRQAELARGEPPLAHPPHPGLPDLAHARG